MDLISIWNELSISLLMIAFIILELVQFTDFTKKQNMSFNKILRCDESHDEALIIHPC